MYSSASRSHMTVTTPLSSDASFAGRLDAAAAFMGEPGRPVASACEEAGGGASWRRGDALLDDDALLALADRFGTPLYIFDERALRDRASFLRSMLPRGTGLCYAMKANTFVLPELVELVDRVEVCSPGEYRICREVSVPSEKLVVSGVHKDAETVDAALADGSGRAVLTIESAAQMQLVDELASRHGVRTPVLLRLTSGNQFGLDAALVRELVGRYRTSETIDLRGIQFFSGTQKTSPRRVSRELEKLDRFLASLEEGYGWTAPELEYGPGLPVAYFEADSFDEAAYLSAFSEALSKMAFAGKVTLEVGRSLVASCGTYLTRVVDTKMNHGERYAIVDGGIHQLVYFGQSMAMHQPACRLLGDAAGGEAEPWSIFGSLCTVNDVLAKQMPLVGMGQGRVLAFANVGAYCMTEGISLFLSRDLPRVVVLDSRGEPRLVRDALRTDVLNTPSVCSR